MGLLSSKDGQASNEFKTAASKFTSGELQAMQTAFEKAAHQPISEARLKQDAFLGLIRLPEAQPALRKCIWRAVAGEGQIVSFEQFLIASAHSQKGLASETEAWCFAVLAGPQQGAVGQADFLQILQACAQQACTSATKGAAAGERLGTAAATGAFGAATSTDTAGQRMDPQHFHAWSKQWPALLTFLRNVLSITAWHGLPQMLLPEKCETRSLLLQPEWAWMLAAKLPAQQSAVWELLFNSDLNGKSFNTFLGRAMGRGPTLLLVRDAQGQVFGGYASQAWQKQGKFYGDLASFIFTLMPTTAVFHPAGINNNIQYCGQGFSAIPNGIGFGGQVGYWSMFVDETLDKGMSRRSATFNSPCLAAQEKFAVDTVECWLLQQPEEEGPPPSGHAGSVLDRQGLRFKGLIAGHTGAQHSRGLRDEPLEE
eukprot:jgi/Astpho2/1842/Aster-x1044